MHVMTVIVVKGQMTPEADDVRHVLTPPGSISEGVLRLAARVSLLVCVSV